MEGSLEGGDGGTALKNDFWPHEKWFDGWNQACETVASGDDVAIERDRERSNESITSTVVDGW